MKSPPTIKKPAARDKAHSGQPKETLLQQSGNIQRWSVPPDDRDGFDVHIGGRGHIILTQRRCFEQEAEIVLNPVEAVALKKILPLAITAANEIRREVCGTSLY